MTAISNLPHNLLEEILCRVPITSLRAMKSTCKLWNKLLQDPLSMHIAKASKEIMFISTYTLQACLMSVDIENNDLVDPFIKQIGELKEVEIHKVFHCTGLLLCLSYENSDPRLLVWNPYLGTHTSWIEPRRTCDYRTGHHHFSMGYDNNNNLKIMRNSQWYTHNESEIYDFKSRSWRVVGISTKDWDTYGDAVSLKGDSYIIAYQRTGEEPLRRSIICFDFTRERFWSLPQPCDSESSDLKETLSVVSEMKLVVLSKRFLATEMKIWITNKIEPNAVSWSYYLKFDNIPCHRFYGIPGTLFLDEKKKVAVICDPYFITRIHFRASMVGEGGIYREMEFGGLKPGGSLMWTTYVPSLMQIQ